MAKAKTITNSVVEIRNYPTSLILKHKNEDGSDFSSFSFLWKKNWASCILPSGALTPSTTRKGKTIEGRMNISLGDPERVRNVSIQKDDNTYQRTPMFNRSILPFCKRITWTRRGPGGSCQ